MHFKACPKSPKLTKHIKTILIAEKPEASTAWPEGCHSLSEQRHLIACVSAHVNLQCS